MKKVGGICLTIYVDVVFIENLLLNYIILCATAIIGKNKLHFLRFLLASSFGSLYAILNYIISLTNLENFLLKLFISSFMILISFDNKKIKIFLKNLIMFYLTSFTFGGAAFMLLFFVSPESIIYENGHFIGTYPLKITFFGGALGFAVIALVAKFIKNKISNTLCDLEISFKGKIIKIKTLVDSGNLLKEPISNQDVIVVQKSSLEGLIDKKILDEAISMVKGSLIGDMREEFYKFKFKIIPFSSLGNENGVLVGFKPDYIKIYSDEEFIKKDVIIGIYDGNLSKTNLYTSLIGLGCFKKEGVKDEYITSS